MRNSGHCPRFQCELQLLSTHIRSIIVEECFQFICSDTVENTPKVTAQRETRNNYSV